MYLSAQAIRDMAGQKRTHFLNSNAVRINKSLGDEVGLKNIGVHLITIQPGHYSTEPHAHLFEEECIYVLSGRAIATLGSETQEVGAGDFIGYPINGIGHCLQAIGTEPLICLVLGQRLAQDVADYTNLKKRLYRNNGEWNLVDHADIQRIQR
ncbi:cupin domain-containing protein [Stenotrophobium rhamnosiphilum]|uniref:Cupin n=1 Tax=Stenotrophobium rhamnosiphilum TaxID=2029166 RepID=A0A2T5MCB7_9GAMM|nr:cupin domain-containing protein [Stenotrophobium rhamnosiphilum]PTU30206.1 cupin [Stenotrophobium rhamnosiphilum]